MVYDIIPSENVKYDDIRDTLNANGGAVTNDIRTAFLDTAKINIWSFYKPHHAIINFPSSVPNAVDASGSLYYDASTQSIKYNRPTGGENSPYRLSDFCGYKYKSLPPSVDSTGLTATANLSTSILNLTVEPYWADPNFDLGKIFGLNFNEMKIKVEAYNQNKTLLGSNYFTVGDVDATGRYSLNLTAIGLSKSDTKIYLKGYFCDSYNNILCIIPSSEDGFVEKPLTITQSIYFYTGTETSLTTGFTPTIQLVDGEGSASSEITLSIYNDSGSNYIANTEYPIIKIRYRAYDGSYTGSWITISSSEFNNIKNIPNGFTRSDTISLGAPPSYGNVVKWYIDVQIQMK